MVQKGWAAAVVGSFLTIGGPAQAADLQSKKVLFIDSYSEAYQWSADIARAIAGVIDQTGAELRVAHMDTKIHGGEAYKIAKGVEMKALVGSYQPDVVIACDDNAAKYVIAPYFRDAAVPVVFCGINWDASKYGFPARNITGMVEINSFREVLGILDAAGGDRSRVAALTPDTESERADLEQGGAASGVTFRHVRYVSTFEAWKAAFVELQTKADMVLIHNNGGIRGWNDEEASRFVAANTKVLTASFNTWMAPFVAVTFAKVGSEQGHWAGDTAVRILAGTKPSDIPLTYNRQDLLIVNRRIAGLSKFVVPQSLFDAARVIE